MPTEEKQRPLRLFVSYSHEDRRLKDRFLTHLGRLEQNGVQIWHDTAILSGRWRDQVDHNLNEAEVILLLISPAFLQSKECNTEMQAALKREELHQSLVIPVLLKAAEWQSSPIGHLQVLPTGGRPIGTLRDRDSGFVAVVGGIRRAIGAWVREQREPVSPEYPAPSIPDTTPGSPEKGPTLPPNTVPIDAPEFRYRNLFTIGPLTIPYIVLVSSLESGIHEYRYGDLDIILKNEQWDKLPVDFDIFLSQKIVESETKCRFESLRWYTSGSRPFRLEMQFSEISYQDYLKSGEHLDDPLPGSSGTFRDKYVPDLPSTHVFSSSPLTNITGVGVVLITRDDQVIISKHSDNVYVHRNALSYSASGTMDWKTDVHPFTEIIRECWEELGYRLSAENLRLFSIGIDAKRQYFQLSFYAEVPHCADYIVGRANQAKDFSFEFDDVVSFPLNVDTIISLAKKGAWEPAALAALLTLTAKRFGVEPIQRAIDEAWFREQYRQSMAAEWKHRAVRPGELAVMSDRYPLDKLTENSRAYVDAVMAFIGNDIEGKDVVEIGAGIGRITQRLVERAGRVTCVDLNEEMIRRNREFVGRASQDILYYCCFAQDYEPSVKHDVAVASLVLVHNVSALAFSEAVNSLMRSADTIFVFEHSDPEANTSVNTKTRSIDELVQAFHGYNVERRSEYLLFSDRIVFLKLVRVF